MIVQLTPDRKFVCDRCGREEYPNENGELIVRKTVIFAEENYPFGRKNNEHFIKAWKSKIDQIAKEMLEGKDEIRD